MARRYIPLWVAGLVLLLVLVRADLSTYDGVAINDASTRDGVAGLTAYDGVALAASAVPIALVDWNHSGDVANSDTIVLAITNSVANGLIAFGISASDSSDTDRAVSSVVDDVSGALTEKTPLGSVDGSNRSALWYIIANASTGVHTVTVTFGGIVQDSSAVISSWEGVNVSTPITDTNVVQTVNSFPNGAACTTADGGVVLGFLTTNSAVGHATTDITWNTGTQIGTYLIDMGSPVASAAYLGPNTPAGSYTPTATDSASTPSFTFSAMSLNPQ